MDREHDCPYRIELEELKAQFAILLQRVEVLEAELAKYKKPPKDSSNSGVPPSKDQNRRHYPKREQSGKKPGGQLGHPGHSHPMTEHPDTVVECPLPEACPHCGEKDWDVDPELCGRMQVVDIPPVKPHVTEYHQKRGRCRRCETVVKSSLPGDGPVEIGEHASALATFFKTCDGMSDERVVEALSLFGLKVSEGWVEKTLSRQAEWFSGMYEAIRQGITASRVRGSDETGVRINGKRGYIWIAQTSRLVYFKTEFSRSFRVIEGILGKGFQGTHVSDRYGGQLKLEAGFNQYCLAHIVRECRYLEEAEKSEWAARLKSALRAAMDFRREHGENYQPGECRQAIGKLEDDLSQCFAHGPPEGKHSARLYRGLRCHLDKLIRFLHDPDVPPTNNDSERPLRHWALLKKVFGGFRTLPGVNRYDVLLSIVQSAKRQGLNVLDVLSGQVQIQTA